jgi:hypothetical protein
MKHSLTVILLLLLTSPRLAADDGVAFFEKKIRPVLVEHCYACHSAEAQAKKKLRGGLLLDTSAGLLAGGDTGPAIVAGKPKDSLLLKSLRHEGDLKMPPKGKLSPAVVADFEAWVARGAPDPRTGAVKKQRGLTIEEGRAFWSYQPPKRAPLAIDAQLLAAMTAKGLRPAPQADRPTLIRRLSYDLVGMPPSPNEIDAFLNDARPDAYERLVERLLASPHFGERWGRHWLDLARFAESLTLRGFVQKEAWRYRDYVIDCFNDDVPYDRFVREQVAGDLLPASSVAQKRRQRVATTFLALGNTNLEEQDKQQLRMDVVDEQLDTIGRAFLAQTLGCARCHDHKFDPVPTKDYYAMAGILRNTRTLTHANVSMWLEFPLPGGAADEKAIQAHETAVAALQRQINALKGTKGKGAKEVRVGDLPGVVIDDASAKKVGAWTESKHTGPYVAAGYVHDANAGKGEKTITFQPAIPKTGKYEVWLSYTPGTNRDAKVPVTVFSADGDKTVHIDQRKAPDIDGLFVSLGKHTFEKSGQGFVLVANEGTTGHVVADAVVFLPAEDVAEKKEVKKAVSSSKLSELEARMKRLKSGGPKRDMAMAVDEEKAIEETRVHVRGSVHNLGEKAPRGFLRVALAGPEPKMPAKESGRRELADWLASADNPLTARVIVNRAWHWLMGAGLVRTTDNFGTTGEKPSHPELLDAMALQFVEDGWSMKTLVRRIVLSRAYRQESGVEPRDPENRLWSRANRRRLEAESIRDTMLVVSGQLTRDRGGPTFGPGVAADYGYKHTDTRRSVYSPVFRNALPELFEAFDFADPSVTTGRRNVSTVAPQALFLMNHPFVLDQAGHAARRLLGMTELSDRDRVSYLYRQALGRPPADAESALIEAYLAEAGGREQGWSRVVQVVFASLDFRHVK